MDTSITSLIEIALQFVDDDMVDYLANLLKSAIERADTPANRAALVAEIKKLRPELPESLLNVIVGMVVPQVKRELLELIDQAATEAKKRNDR